MLVHRGGPRGARGGASRCHRADFSPGPTFATQEIPPHVPHVAHSVLYASGMLWAFMGANARVGVGCIVALEVIACAFVVTRGSLRCVALAHVTPHPRECPG